MVEMSAELPTELEAFRQFIDERLGAGDLGMSPEEALEHWRSTYPSEEDLVRSTLAVKQAIADMQAGDDGEPFEAFVQRFRQERGLPGDA
jgi:N-acyl-D-aspartate/D-glutamate deacylase